MEHQTPLMHDLARGFRCRCPNCGEGKLFASFLKTRENCAVCGQEFFHHRADDFPAYIVLLIVGHAAVAFALAIEDWFSPETWVHMVTTLPLTLILTLGLLQPVKGTVIALQWRLRMHGFKHSRSG